jgi:hypothetical protein
MEDPVALWLFLPPADVEAEIIVLGQRCDWLMGEKQEAERKLSEEARKLGKEEWYSNTIERQQDDEKKGREALEKKL